jgi:hypothetical protein
MAWQLSWLVVTSFCLLASVWFLLLTVPDESRPLAWVLALLFGLLCLAAAVHLRSLLWEAFMSPSGQDSYSSVLVVTSLWAFISAGLMAACSRVGAVKAARACAVSFVGFSVASAYCFWMVL